MSSTTSGSSRRSAFLRMSVNQWVALVLTVLAAVFIIQNRGRVTIGILQVDITAPMWLVLLVMFAVGWLAGWLTRRRSARKTA